eukprot:Plantae.Rhodophyta-Rhodochaete_pulchella.ctg12151.p1 GENE.Plantae.Rhodophyta-Rhodochaete_pulchella.ctg12151~~Plantae.Rhodophyta-Rhodochaete_pulchella.ctg12151.p1  ORF type:complete len:183 (-),score=19.05 Plantae.Rhodophyta-Rhodochaete_pulchella.ctg12151:612-1160(-)
MAVSDKHRCVQCGVTETPLWRSGPAGPKTLCNACGVRFKKTGKLVSSRDETRTNPARSSGLHKAKVSKPTSVSEGSSDAQRMRQKSSSSSSSASGDTGGGSLASSGNGPVSVLAGSSYGTPSKLFLSPILEEYLRSASASATCTLSPDATNYQCVFSGLMVVQKSSLHKGTRRRSKPFNQWD